MRVVHGLLAFILWCASGLAALAATPAPCQVLSYQNDFDATPGVEWSRMEVSKTPIGGIGFLGPFSGNEEVFLTLTNLPLAGTLQAEIAFQLFVIGPWTGNQPAN